MTNPRVVTGIYLFVIFMWLVSLFVITNRHPAYSAPSVKGLAPTKTLKLDKSFDEVWCYGETALIVNSRHAVLAVSENSAFCTAR